MKAHMTRLSLLVSAMMMMAACAAPITDSQPGEDQDDDALVPYTTQEFNYQSCNAIAGLCAENCGDLYPDGAYDPGCNCQLKSKKQKACRQGCLNDKSACYDAVDRQQPLLPFIHD